MHMTIVYVISLSCRYGSQNFKALWWGSTVPIMYTWDYPFFVISVSSMINTLFSRWFHAIFFWNIIFFFTFSVLIFDFRSEYCSEVPPGKILYLCLDTTTSSRSMHLQVGLLVDCQHANELIDMYNILVKLWLLLQ